MSSSAPGGARQIRVGAPRSPWAPATRALEVLALAALAQSAFAQTTIVKMATFAPAGSTWHQVLREMGEEWKTGSAGRVVLRLYPGGVAGDDADVVRKMRRDSLQAGLLTSLGLAEVDRSALALALPLAYDSHDEAAWVLERMRPGLEKGFAARGFVVLDWVDGGWARFFAQKPVASPDDLRRLKLFSWASDEPTLEVWKAAGFDPVSLPLADLGAALQAGRVNALGLSPQLAVLSQHYTRAPYMTDLRFQLLPGAVVMSQSAWEQVPPDLRPVLTRTAREAGRRLREEMGRSADRDLEEMRKRGLTVVAVDPKARAEWGRAATIMLAKARGTVVPAEACDEALRLRDLYRRGPGAPR